jgi:hypothetical protein
VDKSEHKAHVDAVRRRVQQMQRFIFGEPGSPNGHDAGGGRSGSMAASDEGSHGGSLRRSLSGSFSGSFSSRRGSGGGGGGGDADKSWQEEEASERAVALLSETLQAADVMPQLLAQLKAVDFETRKDVASVFCHLVRNDIASFSSEYLRYRPHVVYQVRARARALVRTSFLENSRARSLMYGGRLRLDVARTCASSSERAARLWDIAHRRRERASLARPAACGRLLVARDGAGLRHDAARVHPLRRKKQHRRGRGRRQPVGVDGGQRRRRRRRRQRGCRHGRRRRGACQQLLLARDAAAGRGRRAVAAAAAAL